MKKASELGVWFQNFKLPDGTYTVPGESIIYPPWVSVVPFAKYFQGKSVLDVGCNAGMMAMQYEKYDCSVTAFDMNPKYIEQAQFIKDTFGLKFKLLEANFVTDVFKQHDVVSYCGIMYHLDDPIGNFRKALSLAKEYVVIETAFYDTKESVWWYGGINISPAPNAPSLYLSTLVPSIKAIEDLVDYCGGAVMDRNVYTVNRCSYVVKPRVKPERYPGCPIDPQ